MKFLNESFEVWGIEAMTGYKPMTTFWQDFSIADKFGAQAIKDTYKNGFEYAKTNYKYLTEFVMVLNWKLWTHYENGNHEIAKLYETLWQQADTYACENLKDEELSYFYETTD